MPVTLTEIKVVILIVNRSSQLNCELQGDEAVHCVSIGQQLHWLVLSGTESVLGSTKC